MAQSAGNIDAGSITSGHFYGAAGARACLHHLKSQPELNTKAGTLGQYDESAGRWEFFADCGKQLKVKPANLFTDRVIIAGIPSAFKLASTFQRAPITGHIEIFPPSWHYEDVDQMALAVRMTASSIPSARVLVHSAGEQRAYNEEVAHQGARFICTPTARVPLFMPEELLTELRQHLPAGIEVIDATDALVARCSSDPHENEWMAAMAATNEIILGSHADHSKLRVIFKARPSDKETLGVQRAVNPGFLPLMGVLGSPTEVNAGKFPIYLDAAVIVICLIRDDYVNLLVDYSLEHARRLVVRMVEQEEDRPPECCVCLEAFNHRVEHGRAMHLPCRCASQIHADCAARLDPQLCPICQGPVNWRYVQRSDGHWTVTMKVSTPGGGDSYSGLAELPRHQRM